MHTLYIFKNPTPHTHAAPDTLPTTLRVAGGHAVHTLEPTCDEYVCAGHSAHGPLGGPLLPAGHWHESPTRTSPLAQAKLQSAEAFTLA